MFDNVHAIRANKTPKRDKVVLKKNRDVSID